MFNLNNHTHRLFEAEPVFAAISRRTDKHVSRDIPTAGVRINPETGYYEMLYNDEFFEKLPDEHRLGVLMHEFYHLMLFHVSTRLPDELEAVMKDNNPTKEQQQLFMMWNLAADLSINPLIGRDKLPKECCFPGIAPFDDPEFIENQTAEYYYKILKEKREELKDEIENGEGQMDDHSGWGGEEVPDHVKEIAKERLRQTIKKAVEDTEKEGRGYGSVSSKCRKQIKDMISNHVDWRVVLRSFIKRSNRANKSSTVKRINRRYPYAQPGRKVRREANIAIAIDQSGSVSNEMLAQFFAELNKLAKLASFTVVPFDTQVVDSLVYKWEKGQRFERKRVMYGGTDFNAPTKYVNKNNFDGMIVLTDMEAPKPIPCKCQRMWMTTPMYANHPYFNPRPEQMIVVR